jgi:hypothetical protein
MPKRTRPLPPLEVLREAFTYDAEVGTLVRADGYRGYVNNLGYRQITLKNVIYSAHRIAWTLAHGRTPDGEIDHINGVRGDNRLRNLRLVTSAENNRNRRLSKHNRSGVKGVCWESSRRKWRATIGRPTILVGRFDNLEEAKEAIIAAREKLHGEFANHGHERAA